MPSGVVEQPVRAHRFREVHGMQGPLALVPVERVVELQVLVERHEPGRHERRGFRVDDRCVLDVVLAMFRVTHVRRTNLQHLAGTFAEI
jgi:hypothetical protein